MWCRERSMLWAEGRTERSPVHEEACCDGDGQHGCSRRREGEEWAFYPGEMGATAGVDWPRCVRLSSCVMLALIPLLSANS